MDTNSLKAEEVSLGGMRASRIAFGTEHLNQYIPEFGGSILHDAAVQNNVFFWDTDNCYGSQPAVAAALKMIQREKVSIASKTYADTKEEALNSVSKILYDLDTPYLDLCVLHGVECGRLPYKAGAIEALLELKEKKIVRHIGLSTHSSQVAWEASDVEGIEVLCVTFNRMGSWIDQGTTDDMAKALDKAHNKRHIGTYVIKTLDRGGLVSDLKNALTWVMDHHDCIDVYNIGHTCLRELRQNLSIVNDYYNNLEGL